MGGLLTGFHASKNRVKKLNPNAKTPMMSPSTKAFLDSDMG